MESAIILTPPASFIRLATLYVSMLIIHVWFVNVVFHHRVSDGDIR